MRKILTMAVAVMLVAGLTPGIAMAASGSGNPAFQSVSGEIVGTTLTVTFTLTGLGNVGKTVNITLSADVTFNCFANGQGQETSAHKTLTVTQSFTPHAGTIKDGSLSLSAKCPGNQTESDLVVNSATLSVATSTGTVLVTATSSNGTVWTF